MSETPLAPLERHNVPAAQPNYQSEIANTERYLTSSEVAVSDSEHLNLFAEDVPRAEVFDQMNADKATFTVPGEVAAIPLSHIEIVSAHLNALTPPQKYQRMEAIGRTCESLRDQFVLAA